MGPLTVAVPKGRMQEQLLDLFRAAGYAIDRDLTSGRKLIFQDATGTLRFVLARPSDVPTYVEYGAADLGVVGEDVLRESNCNLYEPLRLGVGHCHLALAGPAEARQWNLRLTSGLRVASKYPRLARDYFQRQGIAAEIIPLSGSVELAPALGLADLLVDLVGTGRTLLENDLVELETIMESEATLVVNRASHKLRLKAVQEVIAGLAAEIARRRAKEAGE